MISAALPATRAESAVRTAAFAMTPGLQDKLFTTAALTRLAQLVAVDTKTVIRDFSTADQTMLSGLEVLVTGWGCPPIGRSELNLMPQLKVILHAAGSIKGHLSPEVWHRGIRVSSAAEANALPVAEFSLAMILLAGKEAFWISREYDRREKGIDLLREYPDIGNFQRTVGIVGASKIGRRVMELLTPHDVEVLVYDPYLDNSEASRLGARLVDLPELMTECSIVSLHAPSLPTTTHMIDAAGLASMQDGATLLNTARASLVDQEALVAELRSGRLRAVLDVTEPEVLPPDHELRTLHNVFITPHLAGAQGNELIRLGQSTMAELERVLTCRGLRFEVALEQWERTA